MSARDAAKVECPAGHKYTPENTYIQAKGSRRCRACNREQMQAKRAQQKPAPTPPAPLERNWRDQAECLGMDVGLFFPTNQVARAAKDACRRCPVRQECLEWALETDTTDGIWGGLSAKARRRLAAERKAVA